VIVADASAIVDLLLAGPGTDEVRQRLVDTGEVLICPHLLDIEVLHALRRLVRKKRLDPTRGSQALADLAGLPLLRHDHEPLLRRMWELRHSLSACDAAYVVLAETAGVPLVTRDVGLARSTGHGARIEPV
jgi:predicted nucleic acid-binding protein